MRITFDAKDGKGSLRVEDFRLDGINKRRWQDLVNTVMSVVNAPPGVDDSSQGSPYFGLSFEERVDYIKKRKFVQVRLLRRSRENGRVQSVGSWPSMSADDVLVPEPWIRKWSGGGLYVLNAYDPEAPTFPILEQHLDLDGDELEPLDVRNEKKRNAQKEQD